jgi:uncharacterized lipoprotein YajG
METTMKTITLLCGLLLLAACADQVPAPTNVTDHGGGNVQDCQRADASEPCR